MLPTAIHIHPAVIATPLRDGETVLLHLDSKRYFSLNAIGGLYWRALGSTAVDLADLPADAAGFVADLIDQQLLQPADTGRRMESWPVGDTAPNLKTYPALAGITFLSGGGVSGPVVI